MNGLIDPGVALYVSAAVAVVVWAGIFFYLWRIDAQARALRESLQNRQQSGEQPAIASAPLRPERQHAPIAPKEAPDA